MVNIELNRKIGQMVFIVFPVFENAGERSTYER